jgi:4-aminobutyrate aminotransferase
LMIGVELVKDQQSRQPVGAMRDRVVELAFERGLIILGCGETSIRLCPPLILKQQEADVALDILEECVMIAAKS